MTQVSTSIVSLLNSPPQEQKLAIEISNFEIKELVVEKSQFEKQVITKVIAFSEFPKYGNCDLKQENQRFLKRVLFYM